MPLFDPPVPDHLLWPKSAPWPKRRARALLKRFQNAFGDLTYDMELNVDLANAQAFLDGSKRRVRLFGGLVRHRGISSAGLAVTLAHETGHHLGGPPAMKYFHWLSAEDRATEWAITVGLPTVFGSAAAIKISAQGVAELDALAPGK